MPKSFAKKASQKEKDAENMRRRAFVKEELFPWLVKNTKNIEDAKLLCKAAVMIMQERFGKLLEEHNKAEQLRLSGVQFSELGVIESFKGKEEKKILKEFEGLFRLLDKEKVSTAEAFLKGMQQALEVYQIKEMRSKKLDVVNIDDLMK